MAPPEPQPSIKRSIFHISADEFPACTCFGTPQVQDLIGKVIPFAQHSVSGEPLAVFGHGLTFDVFLGVNIELPAVPLLHTMISPVQFLVANLARHKETELDILAFSPDGTHFVPPSFQSCQFLSGIKNARAIKTLIVPGHPLVPLGDLININYDPGNDVPRLLDPIHLNLQLLDLPPNNKICNYDTTCNHLWCNGLAAAQRSVAPYSQSPSGMAMRDKNGAHYDGWFMESAVPQLILGPLQAAPR